MRIILFSLHPHNSDSFSHSHTRADEQAPHSRELGISCVSESLTQGKRRRAQHLFIRCICLGDRVTERKK